MDWFKNNPFPGLIVLLCAVILVGGGFLAFSEATRLGEEQSNFDQKTAELQRLLRNKPYPDKANVETTAAELENARALLTQIAEKFRAQAPSATPQGFQDELAERVQEIAAKAQAKNVALPENFYLGFEQYETQLPPGRAASALTVQLRSIHAVVSSILDAAPKSLGPVARPPIAAESDEPSEEPPGKGRGKEKTEQPEVEFAPFDISFNAEQSAFRLGFNRVLELDPPVFLRLVSLENSASSAPPKAAAAGEETEAGATEDAIRPVVGRETINVSIRMASVVPSPAPSN